MLAHFLGALALLGAALLIVLGVGIALFGLARGDRALARRAAIATGAFAALYLLGIAVSAFAAPRRVLPIGEEVSFCGFDCHMHVSVVGSETDENRVGVFVQVRNDARQEPEYPKYLQFRLIGNDNTVLVPDNEGRPFVRPLAAGQTYLDSLYFTVSLTNFPYTLRVIYPDLPEALLLGPANSRASGKTTLGLGDSPT
jgi:hypothetical protein